MYLEESTVSKVSVQTHPENSGMVQVKLTVYVTATPNQAANLARMVSTEHERVTVQIGGVCEYD